MKLTAVPKSSEPNNPGGEWYVVVKPVGETCGGIFAKFYYRVDAEDFIAHMGDHVKRVCAERRALHAVSLSTEEPHA